MSTRMSRIFCIAFISSIIGSVLLGCATSENSANPARNLALMSGIATEIPQAADFVTESRTGALDYMPIGVLPIAPKKPRAAMTPEELAALKEELEAARRRNRASGMPQQ